MNDWTPAQARALYNIAHWGNGYFDVDEAGELTVRPDPAAPHPGIPLSAIVRALNAQGLRLPTLLRFSGILHHRVDALCSAFARASQVHGYHSRYTAVYPIKVNQQKSVVDAILAHGGDRVGLEAGSKPELLAVLARSRPGAVVVCNGYKDREFIRLALHGRALGLRVHLVLEKLSELEMILAEACALGVVPLLGVRVRLASLGAGKWQNTGGEKSKFGLTAAEVLRVIARLREAGFLDSLVMMHFHMGSQIANIEHVQNGLREAARYYCALREEGAPIATVNVGGGLGVDYEGTRSRSHCSMNYSMEEYADNIVRSFAEAAAAHRLPQPDLITEAGRAMTAHHAVLVTQVMDVESAPGLAAIVPVAPHEHPLLRRLWEGLHSNGSLPVLEIHHNAAHALNEARALFAHGGMTLAERARAEELWFATAQQVRLRLQPGVRAHREALDELNEKLADKYFCNFSLFQSMPDHWALDQIFPVLPISRLNEPPTRRAVLQDITCDSDGSLDYYVEGEGIETSLPLHAPREGEPYLIGIFLIGAYQEILGDLHNLFGDTDSVNVASSPEGGWRFAEAYPGDTVADVLRDVRYEAGELLEAYEDKIRAAAGLGEAARAVIREEMAAGLDGYTYLEE